jgi:hypothetical protein
VVNTARRSVYAFSTVGQLTPSNAQSASWRLFVVRQPGHG